MPPRKRLLALFLTAAVVASGCAATVMIETTSVHTDRDGTAASTPGDSSPDEPLARPPLAYEEAIDIYLTDVESFWAEVVEPTFGVAFSPVDADCEVVLCLRPKAGIGLVECRRTVEYRQQSEGEGGQQCDQWDRRSIAPSLFLSRRVLRRHAICCSVGRPNAQSAWIGLA